MLMCSVIVYFAIQYLVIFFVSITFLFISLDHLLQLHILFLIIKQKLGGEWHRLEVLINCIKSGGFIRTNNFVKW